MYRMYIASLSKKPRTATWRVPRRTSVALWIALAVLLAGTVAPLHAAGRDRKTASDRMEERDRQPERERMATRERGTATPEPAMERDRQSEHAISAGWMQTRVYNEYIGILPYEGPQFGLLYDGRRAMRPENMFQEWRIQGEIGGLMNPAKSRRQTSGRLQVHYGLGAAVFEAQGFDIRVGGQLQWDSRLFYQPAYGNSCFQVGTQLQLAFNARFGYEFLIKEFPIRLHYRIALPLAGVGFAPDFGHSYYEIVDIKGEIGRQLIATSLHNVWNLQNEFGMDFVFKRCVLRLSYVGYSLWSHYKNVWQEWHSHGVQLGFVLRMENASGR